MATLVCHSCGTPITYGEPVPRDAECEKCRADLRTCRNCRHWNPRLNNECNETEADSIATGPAALGRVKCTSASSIIDNRPAPRTLQAWTTATLGRWTGRVAAARLGPCSRPRW